MEELNIFSLGDGKLKKNKKEQLLLNIKGLSCSRGRNFDQVTPEDTLGEWQGCLRD